MHLRSPLWRVTLLSFCWCMMASFCEVPVLRENEDKFKIVMLDPVAKSRLELPTLITYNDIPTPVTCLEGDFLPTITTPVDNTSLTFIVFLINDWLWQSHCSRVSVYESSTGAWRGCQIHQRGMGLANSRECLKHHLFSSKGIFTPYSGILRAKLFLFSVTMLMKIHGRKCLGTYP